MPKDASPYLPAKWRVLPLILGFCAFTYFSTVYAHGNVFGARAPDTAVAVTPTNGFALGRIANREIRPVDPEAVSGLIYEIADYERPRKLAIEALLREPTDMRAAGVLSALKIMQGRETDVRLNAQILSLSRRAVVPQLVEIDRAARAQSYSDVLRAIDQLLRVNPGLREAILPSLVALLGERNALPAMEIMLRRSPDWRIDFWRLAAAETATLENAVRLRERLGAPSDFRELRNDEFLLQALVNTNEFTKAEDLAAKLFADFNQNKTESPLRNGDFSAEPRYRPFDWRFFSRGLSGASLQPGSGQMIISTSNGGSGVVASQLVRLAPGRYAFAVKAEELNGESEDKNLAFELACARTPAVPVMRADLAQARGGIQFNVAGECAFHSLTIALEPSLSELGHDFVLEEISLTRSSPLTGQSSAQPNVTGR